MLSLVVTACLLSTALCAEVCYPPCGCFGDMANRPLPEGFDTSPIKWLLYTKDNGDNPEEVPFPEVSRPPSFDPNKRTTFLIHGWVSNRETLKIIRDAILENIDNENLIVVEWEVGASRGYSQSASNTQVVGACSAKVAAQLTGNMGNVQCIGHSLGAHTCGYMGKRSQSEEQQTMRRVSTLDPALPLFNTDDTTIRLDKGDALFVDVMHTNAGQQGLEIAVGHVDFYPNTGIGQPPCDGHEKPSECDHHACLDYFAASISSSGQCQFEAYPCDNIADANNGQCESCSGSNCQRQGWYADTMSGRGKFFLRTTATYPYCLK